MDTDKPSKKPNPPTLNLEGMPKRVRRGSTHLSYIIERERKSRFPSWRWRFAEQLVTSGRKAPPKSIDPIFARVMRYRSLMKPTSSASKLVAFERRHPDLAQAMQVYEQGGLRRWVLEARLLAGQSAEEIASLEGMTTTAVSEYEAVFYNVIGRLGATYWVIGRAIGPRYDERMAAGEVEVVLKTFAHFCGPRMLDRMLQVAVDRNGHFIPLDISNLNSAEAVSIATARLTIELLTCPADLKRFAELVGIHELIRGARRRFSTKTEESAPVSGDSELSERRYDLEFEFPGAISGIDQAASDVEVLPEKGVTHQTGEAEQDRDVA